MNLHDDMETNLINNIFICAGMVPLIGTYKHTKYTMFESRLNSFKRHDMHLKMNSNKLSEAGFFYTGILIIIYIFLLNICCIFVILYFFKGMVKP